MSYSNQRKFLHNTKAANSSKVPGFFFTVRPTRCVGTPQHRQANGGIQNIELAFFDSKFSVRDLKFSVGVPTDLIYTGGLK